MTSSAEDRGRLIVVGAGPAGLAGAAAAADSGIAVTLVDAGALAGGQFYRQPSARFHARRPQALHHDWGTWRALRSRLDDHLAAGRIRHLADHHVWFAERADDGFRVRALIGPEQERSISVTAHALLLATGGYERVLPFPGWTLPGVVTAGGAQAMLKGALVLPGSRVVVAGTGPLLLPVAAALADAGAKVSALIDSASPRALVRRAALLAAYPDKLAEAAGYARRLARHRVPIRYSHAVVAAHGTDRVEAVTIATLDRDGRVRPGSAQRIACDSLAIGHGMLPHLDLALTLGARIAQSGDGSSAVWIDAEQRTDVSGLWAAGEATGIGGAQLAVAEGEIAGRSIGARLRGTEPAPEAWADAAKTRARARAFFAAIAPVYTPPVSWSDALGGETIVCRCEEVPAFAIREAVTDLGATDLRSVKLLTRAGMGWCQGRMCGPGVAAVAGCPLTPAHAPLARPVPLGVLAAPDERGEEGTL